ncbi:MAG: M48 family metalloprotease [Magnetococcales bacterium]|nr:M48 family metalloprotease [Magnetococcales bacterium]
MFGWRDEIDESRILARKAGNFLQTALLFTGMTGLLALLGWMLAGEEGVWWSLILAVVINLMAPSVAPSLILRLSGARWIDPRGRPDLYQTVANLARRADLEKVPHLYYIPSATPNAMAVGSGPDAAVAVSDGLLGLLNGRELTGVLAHEISHIKNGDTRVMAMADAFRRLTLMLAMFGQLLVLLTLPILMLGGAEISLPALLILIAAPTLSALLQLALSRTREFNADLDAAALAGDPHGLASALNKIEMPRRGFWKRILFPLGNPKEPGWLRTHPETRERIHRLMELSNPRPIHKVVRQDPAILQMPARHSRPRFGMVSAYRPRRRPSPWLRLEWV